MYSAELTGYPSIDKPWLKYYPEDAADTGILDMSIRQLLDQREEDMLEQPAMSYLKRRISYGEHFGPLCQQLAAGLLQPVLLELRRAAEET